MVRCETFKMGLWGRPREFRVEAFSRLLSLLALSTHSWALLGASLINPVERANSTNGS